MYFHILTLFPEVFTSFLSASLIKKAQEKNILQCSVHDMRDFCKDRYNQVDDQVYGGGDGMLIKAQPVIDGVNAIIQQYDLKKSDFAILFPSPAQEIFTQKIAYGLSKKEHIIFICGRYEGIDTRAEYYFQKQYPEQFRKISLGQFIVLGGEVPSMIMIEAIGRLVP